ncbi:MAG: hypothetical protein H8E35_13800 [Ardenticatenia bacterium]|nr:hypothetical protein [Ardenticatenia bacterium]
MGVLVERGVRVEVGVAVALGVDVSVAVEVGVLDGAGDRVSEGDGDNVLVLGKAKLVVGCSATFSACWTGLHAAKSRQPSTTAT